MSSIDDKVGNTNVPVVEEDPDEPTKRGRSRADELRRGRQSNILGVVDDAVTQRKSLLG